MKAPRGRTGILTMPAHQGARLADRADAVGVMNWLTGPTWTIVGPKGPPIT
jgi:hypothetical protein